MNQIDRLFSDALQHHSSPAQAGLWERVESGLPAVSSRWTWMRWAAIVVPAVVAVGIWMNRPEEQAPTLANESPAAIPVPAVAIPEPINQTTVAAVTPSQPRLKATKQEPLVAFEVPITEAGTVEEVTIPEEIAIEPVALETEAVAAVPETSKPIVLVYTLETVASPDEGLKKETSLERVVEFASKVKHSDPIGEVRGLKDELFALDFRKKQTKKN